MKSFSTNHEIHPFIITQSPLKFARDNKENLPLKRLRFRGTKKLGNKLSLSPNILKKREQSTIEDYDPHQLEAHHKQLYERILSKITSQVNILDNAPNHKKKILQKLTKANISHIEHQQPERSFTNSSNSSFNVWGDTPKTKMSLFDFYQFRYEQFPHQCKKISALDVVKNVKGLMGTNVACGQLPWYTYGLQYKSQGNLLVPRYNGRKLIQNQGLVRRSMIGNNQQEFITTKIQNMRQEHKLRPIRVDQPKRNQMFVGSPEILMKAHILQQQRRIR